LKCLNIIFAAREKTPAIIFIDEIDAIGTKRFDSQTGADREVQRILLELLNQMDGFDQTTNIKVCNIAFRFLICSSKVILKDIKVIASI
tara:strand:- start:66 stop:332 length:267 start_codon:yes stop_codon:yes gene_type:complete